MTTNKIHLIRHSHKTQPLLSTPWCSTRTSDLMIHTMRIKHAKENNVSADHICKKCLKAVNDLRAKKGLQPLENELG